MKFSIVFILFSFLNISLNAQSSFKIDFENYLTPKNNDIVNHFTIDVKDLTSSLVSIDLKDFNEGFGLKKSRCMIGTLNPEKFDFCQQFQNDSLNVSVFFEYKSYFINSIRGIPISFSILEIPPPNFTGTYQMRIVNMGVSQDPNNKVYGNNDGNLYFANSYNYASYNTQWKRLPVNLKNNRWHKAEFEYKKIYISPDSPLFKITLKISDYGINGDSFNSIVFNINDTIRDAQLYDAQYLKLGMRLYRENGISYFDNIEGNGNFYKKTCGNTSSIETKNENNISFNVINDKIIFNKPNLKVYLYSLNGSLIKEETLNSNELDISSISNNFIICQVEDKYEFKTFKIQKR
jgi:hypothetical protein